MAVPIFVEFVAGLGGFMTGIAGAEAGILGLARSGTGGMAGLAAAAPVMGAAVLAAGAVVAGEAVNMAGDFEQSMTRLATTAGESQSNLKMVGDGILDMAGKVGVSANDLATGMYTVESAGFHGADSLKVLQAAAQGAKQENADLAHVTDAVTTALHDYHLPADQAGVVTSQLVEAVSHGKVSFDELTGAMHSVTPLAASAGISLADVAGTLSSMTASGMSADQAAQNMAFSIRGLMNASGPMREELSQIGINSQDLAKNLGTTGLAGSMQQISEAILNHMGPDGQVLLNTFNQSKTAGVDLSRMYDGLDDSQRKVVDGIKDGSITWDTYRKDAKGLTVEQKGQIDQWVTLEKKATGFSQAIKNGGPDAQTYTAALAKATGGQASLAVALQTTGENAGATNAAITDIAGASTDASGNIAGWSEVQENLNQKLSELHATFGELMIRLGQHLIPIVKVAADAMLSFLGFLETHKAAAVALGVVVGTIMVAALIAVTSATVGWTIALLANPVTWIIVAIIAAVVGLVAGIMWVSDHWTVIWALIKYTVETAWHAITGFFTGMYNDTIEIVVGIAVWLVEKWESIKTAIRQKVADVVNGIVDGWNTAKQWTVDKWHEIENAIVGKIVSVATSVRNGVMDVVNGVRNGWNDAVQKTKDAWQSVVDEVHRRWENLKTNVHDAIHSVLRTLSDIGDDIYDATIQPLVDAGNWLSGFVDRCITFGHDMVMGIVRGVKNAGSELLSAVKNVASNALHGAAEFLGIASPSKVFAARIGAPISQGIAAGVTADGHLVGSAIAGVTTIGQGGIDVPNMPASGSSAPVQGQGAGGAYGQQSGGLTVQIGTFYGFGGREQAARDLRDELLKMQQRSPLGFRASA